MRVRESCRIFAVSFAAGAIFGCALDATLNRTWSADLRFGALWGVAFLVVVWLGDHVKWILSQQIHMRKEEVQALTAELNKQISDTKKKITNLLSAGGEGNRILAGMYVDRVIELEKLKERLKYGLIDKDRIEDKVHSDKT